MPERSSTPDKPKIGVSSCLVGRLVRFDGGHKRDRFLTDRLASFVEFVEVCPEMEIGMGAPRESINLRGRVEAPHLIGAKSGEDYAPKMREFAAAKLDALAALDLCGYVLKSDSPSCGMERVRLYDRNHVPTRTGVGVFARALMARFPHLPIEEEGRLNDAVLRESFLERVFAFKRWRDCLHDELTPRRMVDFHRVHKYLLMAHSPKHYSELGRLVALAGVTPRDELAARYGALFFEALREKASVKRHVNVLQHLAGYFKERLDAAAKRELAQTFEDYRARLVPLVVPITLVHHHVRALDVEYLKDQVYLAPGPKELMLRNHT